MGRPLDRCKALSAALLLAWLATGAAADPLGPAPKPRSPLAVELALAPGADERGTLVVTVRSAVEWPSVQVALRIPAGVRLLSGAGAWRGPVRAGRPLRRELELDWSAARQAAVVASARGPGARGVAAAATAVLRLDHPRRKATTGSGQVLRDQGRGLRQFVIP